MSPKFFFFFAPFMCLIKGESDNYAGQLRQFRTPVDWLEVYGL